MDMTVFDEIQLVRKLVQLSLLFPSLISSLETPLPDRISQLLPPNLSIFSKLQLIGTNLHLILSHQYLSFVEMTKGRGPVVEKET